MGRWRREPRSVRDSVGHRRNGRPVHFGAQRASRIGFLEIAAMSDDDTKVPLPDLENGGDIQVVPDGGTLVPSDSESVNRGAADLEAVFDVPVQVSAVLGRAHMEVGNLLKLGPGAVLELDRKVGEAIDIYVNNRLVARGEVVLVEDKLGVTMTEIIKADHN
jgi:flagellar motor switch protein FliN/FliY